MHIYIALFFITALLFHCGFNCKNKFLKILIITIGIVIPSYIAAVRDLSVGKDLRVYVQYQFAVAQYTSSFLEYQSIVNTDFLYAVLTFIIAHVFGNINTLLFCIQFINFLCFTFMLDKKINKKYVFIVSFIYMILFFMRSLNIVRQHLAISMILVFYTLYTENKKTKAYLFFVIGTLFHSSAIFSILIPIMYTLENKKSRVNYLLKVLIILTIIIIFLTSTYFLNFYRDISFLKKLSTLSYSGFVNNSFELDKIDTIFKLFFLFLFIMLVYKNPKKVNKSDFYIDMMIIDFITYEFNIFIKYSERLSFYFGIIAYLFLVPKLGEYIKGDKKSKRIIVNSILVCIMLVYYILKFVYQNAGDTFPYHSNILNI